MKCFFQYTNKQTNTVFNQLKPKSAEVKKETNKKQKNIQN